MKRKSKVGKKLIPGRAHAVGAKGPQAKRGRITVHDVTKNAPGSNRPKTVAT